MVKFKHVAHTLGIQACSTVCKLNLNLSYLHMRQSQLDQLECNFFGRVRVSKTSSSQKHYQCGMAKQVACQISFGKRDWFLIQWIIENYFIGYDVGFCLFNILARVRHYTW